MEERATSRRLVAVASLACSLALFLTLAAILPIGHGLLLTLIALWYAAPGVLVARRVYRTSGGARLLSTAIGAMWGYAASCLVLLALWVAGVRSAAVLLGVPPAIAAVLLRLSAGRMELMLPAPSRRDLAALLFVLLVVPIVVGRPFSRVGELTPDGRAYRAYFTADFFWRMAVTAEVAKGDVPPRNQFFRGDDLRYYWLPDLLPAVEYRAFGRRLRLEQVLLANAVVIDVAFVAFVYAFVRHWTSSAAAAGVGVVAAILFGSFEGAERLIVFARHHTPWFFLRMTNIDAVTRWFYGSLPVDGLQRVLFWKPQHALGYGLGFSALLVVCQPMERLRPVAIGFAGVLLGCALLFSSFNAIMLACIVGAVAGARLAAAGRWTTLVAGAAVAAAPIAAAVGVALLLHYVDRGDSLVRVLVNPAAVTHPWIAIALSFGAMLPVAIAASWLAARAGASRRVAPLWAAAAVAFLFYFFVDVRDHQYVYVGWQAGHILLISFAPLAGLALQELWRRGEMARRMTVIAGVLLAAAAAPTVAIDIYNAQDIANREPGPGFRWTLVLSPDELAALDWIRRYTPPDAIVQVEPHVRDRDTWSYVPTFAERRMAAGLPISMVPLDKYVGASARVRELYQATDARAAHRLARALGVEYLVVGPPEREAYPTLERTLDAGPEHFRPVFRNQSITIYFVERGA